MGRATDEVSGRTMYAVRLENGESWSLDEGELESTGQLLKREDFYDGTSVRIRPNGEVA
jgi:hypothetical protein